MSDKKVKAQDAYEQGKGDDYKVSANYDGLVENAVATPIDPKEDIRGIEEAQATLTSTGVKPDFITVTNFIEANSKEEKEEGKLVVDEGEVEGGEESNADEGENEDKEEEQLDAK